MAKQKEKTTDSSKPNLDLDQGKSLAQLSGITFEVLALNLLIIGGGYYLNHWLDTSFPWMLMLSIFMSILATILYLIKKFN